MCTWLVSTIYSLTPPLPELVPVRHGHPRPPEGPRPRRGAAASQIRRQSTGTRSGDLRSSEAYALPIQGYHMDLSTGACGGAGGPGAQPPVQLTLHTPCTCLMRLIKAPLLVGEGCPPAVGDGISFTTMPRRPSRDGRRGIVVNDIPSPTAGGQPSPTSNGALIRRMRHVHGVWRVS